MSERAAIDALIGSAVATGVVPGGVLVVADRGEVVLERAFGQTARPPHEGSAVTPSTVYDVASLTKPVATTSVVMRLVEAGRLALDTPARALLPELAGPGSERIRVRELLTHSAGLPAWVPLYQKVLAGDRAGAPDDRAAMLAHAAAVPLEAEPGARSLYSDVGFILLGFLVERAGGDRLDALASRSVFTPLGMSATRFAPIGEARPAPVAPTEDDPRRGLLRGEVHDENAHAAGGVLGHAGLFATAGDLSRFAAAMCRAWQGELVRGGFPPALAREFLTPCGVPGSTWRLGWDGPAPAGSAAGALWPRTGSGHLGYTGCSLWLDPARLRWVVLCTNRVHPTRANEGIKQLRPALHDAIVRWLDAGAAGATSS